MGSRVNRTTRRIQRNVGSGKGSSIGARDMLYVPTSFTIRVSRQARGGTLQHQSDIQELCFSAGDDWCKRRSYILAFT